LDVCISQLLGYADGEKERRGEESFMVLLDIQSQKEIPVYRQICDQLAGKIQAGDLPVGAHLPATRVLAGELGVNRSTVCRAYEELWALGFLESTPGSYTKWFGS
jgi:DNA-binding transcriptional regulator YhcF (GntR family)